MFDVEQFENRSKLSKSSFPFKFEPNLVLNLSFSPLGSSVFGRTPGWLA